MVKDRTERILASGFNGKRADMVFQNYIYWDTVNRYLRPHKPKPSTPFFVHLMPKAIYKNWPAFRDLHHCHHRWAVKKPFLFPDNFMCVTDHHFKISRIRKGKVHSCLPSCSRRTLLQRTPGIIGSRSGMIKALEPFGVNPDYVVGDLP